MDDYEDTAQATSAKVSKAEVARLKNSELKTFLAYYKLDPKDPSVKDLNLDSIVQDNPELTEHVRDWHGIRTYNFFKHRKHIRQTIDDAKGDVAFYTGMKGALMGGAVTIASFVLFKEQTSEITEYLHQGSDILDFAVKCVPAALTALAYSLVGRRIAPKVVAEQIRNEYTRK